MRPATHQETELHSSLLSIFFTLAESRSIQDLIKLKLRKLMGSHFGITGVLKVTEILPRKTLSQANLQQELPELFQKYLKPQPEKIRSFFELAETPAKSHISENLISQLEALDGELAKIELSPTMLPLHAEKPEISELRAQYFELTANIAELSLDADIAISKLKAGCGKDLGIEGICTWRRELSE